jgi:hypothetical protein
LGLRDSARATTRDRVADHAARRKIVNRSRTSAGVWFGKALCEVITTLELAIVEYLGWFKQRSFACLADLPPATGRENARGGPGVRKADLMADSSEAA